MTDSSPGNVLVVAAHPDDEVLGCGGTMARLAAEGYGVDVVILGQGATSRMGQGEEGQIAVAGLKECAGRACGKLGVRDVYCFDFPDNRFDGVDLLDIVKVVEGVIDRVRPRIIFTHHGGDLNVDHSITLRAVLTATRPMEGECVEKVYAFEVASSTEWAFGQVQGTFNPDTFIEMGDYLEAKIAALAEYEEEIRAFPHPRSAENIRAAALHWGAASGINAAEAFELVRQVLGKGKGGAL